MQGDIRPQFPLMSMRMVPCKHHGQYLTGSGL